MEGFLCWSATWQNTRYLIPVFRRWYNYLKGIGYKANMCIICYSSYAHMYVVQAHRTFTLSLSRFDHNMNVAIDCRMRNFQKRRLLFCNAAFRTSLTTSKQVYMHVMTKACVVAGWWRVLINSTCMCKNKLAEDFFPFPLILIAYK